MCETVIPNTTIRLESASPPPHPEVFSGSVHMQALTSSGDSPGIELMAVFFDAGARTKPHVHVVDQVLHVVEGEGIVATETERQVIKVGDVLTIPRGLWHWHGATPTTPMCHISLKRTPTGKTEWDVPLKDWNRY
jgi:quercetin dioxygenase-like cupin family protein